MLEDFFFDEATARGLLREFQARGRASCPACDSTLSFQLSSDETRARRWFIKCMNLRCGKSRGIEQAS